MTRTLVCVLFCALFAFVYRAGVPAVPDADVPDQPAASPSLRPEWLLVLASPPHAGSVTPLPVTGLVHMEEGLSAAHDHLPEPDPLVFVEKCLERSRREVQSASLTLRKQERVAGSLHDVEIVEAHYRVSPHQVFLKWLKGARKADAVLYVDGQNNNQLLALPAGVLRFVGVVEKSLDSPESKSSGRYTIDNFGLGKMMERTQRNWTKARERGTLHVDYLGVFRVAEAGNRHCYKLHRTRYEQPEEDGVIDAIVYIDVENWLQVGSVVRGEGGKLIGEYYFRDIRLNPTFATNQFERSALK